MEQRPRTTVEVPTRHSTFIPLYAEWPRETLPARSDFEGRQPDINKDEGRMGLQGYNRMVLWKRRA